LGFAMRFRQVVEATDPNGQASPLDYGLALSQFITEQIARTNGGEPSNLNCALGFVHNGQHVCCAFEGRMQARLLDADHYYVALGTGKLSADPFLRFLSDVFIPGRLPTVAEALFLTTWTIQHAIDTTQGGVAEPIRVATIGRDANGNWVARELPEAEIGERQQAIGSAENALRQWWTRIRDGEAAAEAPPVPQPVDAPAPPVIQNLPAFEAPEPIERVVAPEQQAGGQRAPAPAPNPQ
jgi:hypothetical protein